MIQHPRNISEFSKANACFYMFVDEETEAYVKNSSSLYNNNKVGLWRLVVVQNLPYEDPRRTGKVLILRIAIADFFSLVICASIISTHFNNQQKNRWFLNMNLIST